MVPLTSIEPRTPVRLRIPAREVILALDAPREVSVSNVIPAMVCRHRRSRHRPRRPGGNRRRRVACCWRASPSTPPSACACAPARGCWH
ncbi:MAG: hypothetical protein WDN04_00695 [Rhodospirillales bacterium]